MTRWKMYCPYCNQLTLRYPEELTMEMTHRAAQTGIVRWEHCGVIRFRPEGALFARLLASGCLTEYPDIDREVEKWSLRLATARVEDFVKV